MFVVKIYHSRARLGPALEMARLHPQDRALESLHAVIKSLEQVMIFAILSPIAQHADGSRILGIAGRDCATFAVGSQIFAGIKTEAGHIANAAHRTAFVFRSVSLRGVFDHDQPMP